jgi:hypothetical protein
LAPDTYYIEFLHVASCAKPAVSGEAPEAESTFAPALRSRGRMIRERKPINQRNGKFT